MTGETVEAMRGLIAPILTPFEDDLSIAQDLFVSHALKMIEDGCVGLTPFGTTGEAASLSAEERSNALWHLTQAGIDPKTLIPGTGMLDFQGTAKLSRSFMDMGCAGVMILPPHYYKTVTDDGLFAYYERVIELVGDDLRIYLYHIPHVAGVGLSVPLVQRLRAAFPDQLVGIKDSSGKPENAKALLGIPGLTVYLGSELLLADLASKGAQGTITATANLNAAAISEFVNNALQGDTVGSAYMRETIEIARDVIASRDFIASPKRVLAMRSGDERWANVRPPLVAAPVAAGKTLESALLATSSSK